MSATPMPPTFTQDPLGKHSAYIKELSRRYSVLSKLVLEERSPHLRSSPEADEARTQWLREQVQEAWVKADGNPADGKWGFVTQLLRMGVTSGRNGRWIGARTDIKSPDKPETGSGWLNASSESEWNEWERKFNQEQLLKDKVENWKRTLELHRDEAESARQAPTAVVAESSTSHGVDMGNRQAKEKELASRKPNHLSAKPATAVTLDPLKNAALFGFGVVKRSSQISVLKEKATSSGKQKDAGPSQSSLSGTSSNQHFPNNPSLGLKQGQGSLVASHPEPFLLPPSFSGSQLLTSTPKQIAKPNPFAPQMSSSPLPPLSSSSKLHDTRALLARSSSLSSPKVTKGYGRPDLNQSFTRRQDGTSASLPAIPSPTSPMRNTTSQHSVANKKRSFAPPTSAQGSDPDGRPVKKAKLTTLADNARPNDLVVTPERPQVPPSAVPTLTELLASTKKSKKKRLASTIEPMNSEQRQKNSLQEWPGPIENIEDGDAILDAPMLYRLEDVEMVSGSPAKSLSSISVPDAEDNFVEGEIMVERIEFDPDSPFRPLATSTQVQDPPAPSPSVPNDPITQPDEGRPGGNATDSWESIYAPRPGAIGPIQSSSLRDPPDASGSPFKNSFQSSSKLSYPMYNSQFESAVAMQVDMVDKLLEKDVDYGRWLKDPYANDDGDVRSENSIEDPSSSPGFSPGDAMRGGGENELSYGYGKAFECDQSL